jgi:hypothetical protein
MLHGSVQLSSHASANHPAGHALHMCLSTSELQVLGVCACDTVPQAKLDFPSGSVCPTLPPLQLLRDVALEEEPSPGTAVHAGVAPVPLRPRPPLPIALLFDGLSSGHNNGLSSRHNYQRYPYDCRQRSLLPIPHRSFYAYQLGERLKHTRRAVLCTQMVRST